MQTQEFYIRNASETEARGPFTLEQMVSLADTGQVTADTLYYNAGAEKWVVIKDDAELFPQVFPQRKKLLIKKETVVPTLNKETEGEKVIEVGEMLAAAEGRTADTMDKGAHMAMIQYCAKAGLWGCTLMLLVAAGGEIAPSIDVLTKFTVEGVLGAPLVILGVFDLALAILLFLGVVAVYPMVRFRAMLGIGFLGFLYWTQGKGMHLTAAVAGSVGLYICTIFLRYVPIGIGLMLGLGGMGGLTYLLVVN